MLTSFCLLAPLAFLPLCGKKHKNSRFFWGFSPSRPPTFPSTAWGCRPKTLRSAVRYAHCLTTEFSCGKLALISAKTFSMSQKSCARASKVRVRISLQKHFRLSGVLPKSHAVRFLAFLACAWLTWRDFVESASAHCLPGVFSGRVRAHFAFPACFCGECGRILLSWRDFVESAGAHCLLGAISGRVRTHFAFLAHFWGKCGCILLSRSVLGGSASAFCFLGVFLGKVRVHYGDWSNERT